MSGFQGFGCCSTLFSPLIRRADIQPSTTTPGALGIKGLHTDFRKGGGGGGGGEGEKFERWATPKETILRKTLGMTKRKRCKMKGGGNRQIENPRQKGKNRQRRSAKSARELRRDTNSE